METQHQYSGIQHYAFVRLQLLCNHASCNSNFCNCSISLKRWLLFGYLFSCYSGCQYLKTYTKYIHNWSPHDQHAETLNQTHTHTTVSHHTMYGIADERGALVLLRHVYVCMWFCNLFEEQQECIDVIVLWNYRKHISCASCAGCSSVGRGVCVCVCRGRVKL